MGTVTLSGWKLVVAVLGMLVAGFVGGQGSKMYSHHNEQHWNLEQAKVQQELINQQFIAAINQLAGQIRK